MVTRAWGNEYRLITVCVDSYDDGVFTGRFYNPFWESGKEFRSLTQFLSSVDYTLDSMDFPKPFTLARSFTEAARWKTGPPQEAGREGLLATFAIRIYFRQNASWQGSVVWLEGGKEQSFRSALELIFLMDGVLSRAEQKAG